MLPRQDLNLNCPEPKSGGLPLLHEAMDWLVRAEGFEPSVPEGSCFTAAATNRIRVARAESQAPRAGLEPTVTG